MTVALGGAAGAASVARQRVAQWAFRCTSPGVALMLAMLAQTAGAQEMAMSDSQSVIEVVKIADGEIAPFPIHQRWAKTSAVSLPLRKKSGLGLGTRIRLAYSDTGLYVQVEVEDTRVTATLQEDLAQLWTEDVFELFLWPDESIPAYFEYEISPLGRELPLMVLNTGDTFQGWTPWPYEDSTRVKKAVLAFGAQGPGPARPGQEIEGWIAEIYVPFALLKPIGHNPPRPGDRWRANFYRVDYDSGEAEIWSWQPTENNFHEPEKFGTLLFR